MALTQLTKIDGRGINTTSDYRVGILTAIKFVGPFDGTGGNFAGVVTATDGVFSGNVTIGGTLTYEDVTNIDSVGIITAQKDIHVGAGVSAVGVGTFGSLDIGGDIDVDGHTNLDNLSVAGVSTFTGTVNLSTINSTASNLAIHNTADRVLIKGSNRIDLADDQVRFQNRAQNAALLDATSSYVKLYQSGNEKLSTTNTGVSLPQDLDVDGHTNLDNVSIVGVATVTGSNINIEGGSAALTQLKINSTGRFRGIQLDENGTRKAHFQHDATDNKTVVGTAEGTMQFNSGDTARVVLNSSGHWVPFVDSTYDLGINATRWRNVYADTLYGDGSNLTGISGSIAGISTTGTSNFANIQLIGITTGLNVSGVLTAAQFSGDGANLTSLNASELDSGTLPDARFPATLPAVSGANLTNLPADTPTNSDIQVVYTVTANGSSAYRFAGNGVVSTANNPDLYLIRGQKYRFINNSGGSHPFQIRVASGGSAYSTGVTNNGAASGNIDFAPTYDSPAQLVYQCTSHGGMVGNIYLRGAAGGNTNVGVTTATGAPVTGGNMFLAKMNSGYITSNNTDAEIIFQNEVFDLDSRYNHTNGRFTPNVAGYYFIDASLQFSLNSGNNLFESTIWKNGSEQFVNRMWNDGSNSDVHCKVTGIVTVNGSSDYISIAAWQNSGGNITINPGNGSYFMAYFLRSL